MPGHNFTAMNIYTDAQIAELRQLIDGAQNIIITCHHNPDGDALGSSLALMRYLTTKGKEATVIVPDAYPDFLQWLPNSQEAIRYDKHPDKADIMMRISDLCFCLDFNSTDRVGDEMKKSLENLKAKKVLIDHHLNPNIDAELVISKPEMSSTSEMVFQTICELGDYDLIDKQMATCIYCGMMTDTGAFTYNSADPGVYVTISRLLAKGINKDKIYRNVYWVFSLNRMRLWGRVLQDFKVSKDGHASYFAISRKMLKEYNFIKGDAEGLVNKPLEIKGMQLSISLREDTEKPNLIWVSLRSVDNFPCNKMAEQYFNGGGHLNASGGRLFCSLAEAIQITEKAIEEFKY